MSAPIMIHHLILSPKPLHAFSRTSWSWTFKLRHALCMALGVSLKIAGADEGLGALRAGNLGLNFHGEDGRGWDGRVRAVHGARVCACYSICSSHCLVRREDAVVSGGNINLAGCCSANIGVRDIDGGGMFLANIDSMVVMRRRRGIPTCLKVGCDVLVKKRFTSAGDFATPVKANIEGLEVTGGMSAQGQKKNFTCAQLQHHA